MASKLKKLNDIHYVCDDEPEQYVEDKKLFLFKYSVKQDMPRAKNEKKNKG